MSKKNTKSQNMLFCVPQRLQEHHEGEVSK